MGESFDVAHERLKPLLLRIEAMLGTDSSELEHFEHWALQSLKQLTEAARESKGTLVCQVQAVRGELMQLQHELSVGIAATGRTEVIRVCRREWLMAIIELVDDLFDLSAVNARLVA